MVERHPELDYVLLLEPYSYGLARQARLPGPAGARDVPPPDGAPVRDRQRVPAGPRRPAPSRRRRSSRSGTRPARSSGSGSTPRRRWPSRNGPSCTATTTRSSSAGSGRGRPYAAALRTPIERVLALGSPRTDFFFDAGGAGRGAGARARGPPGAGRPPGRPLRADVPRPRRRQAGGARDGCRRGCGPPCRRTTPWSSRPTRTSTRTATATAGYDVVADPTGDINDLLALTDILITDYSSSIVEFALLAPADHPARRRPRRRTRSTPASTSTTGPR